MRGRAGSFTEISAIWTLHPGYREENNRRFSRDVIAATLVDENKRSLISFSCSSTRSCTFLYLTNRKWFSVVCTLIDNDIRHHSGQNVVDSRGAAEWVYNQFWPLWWRISLLIRVLPQYSTPKKVFISERDRNHNSKKEQALSITFSQYDWFISKNERSWLAITLHDKLTQAWREQCCLDSYRQRQISQSDCEITSNCGKNCLWCL